MYHKVSFTSNTSIYYVWEELLDFMLKQLSVYRQATKFYEIKNLIFMAWKWPICSRNM